MIRILGIDPGSQITGYGVIDADGNHYTHVDHGVIRARGPDMAARLYSIFAGVKVILAKFDPGEAAIEQVFVQRNVDSALKLGQARGAAITACAELQTPLFEYTPNHIKSATVGRGHAAKQQIQHMVRVLLCLTDTPRADAADALAVAICHCHFREGLKRMPGVSNYARGRLR